jgi:hypothetical protein
LAEFSSSAYMADAQLSRLTRIPRTAKYFQVNEVSADKTYLSHKNLEAVGKVSTMPFIPFKINTALPDDSSIWAEMYHYFMYNREGS